MSYLKPKKRKKEEKKLFNNILLFLISFLPKKPLLAILTMMNMRNLAL